jgi:hypothetical protein
MVAKDSHHFNEEQDPDPHINDAEDKCVLYMVLNPFSNLTLYFSSEYSSHCSKKANKKLFCIAFILQIKNVRVFIGHFFLLLPAKVIFQC